MTTLATTYRRPMFGANNDGLFHRCLVGSAIAGAVFLATVLLAPVRDHAVTRIEQLPARFARLIVEKPKPKPLPVPMPAGDVVRPGSADPKAGGPDSPVPPTPSAVQPGAPGAPGTPSSIAPRGGEAGGSGAGAAGRARAQQVVAARLATTTASLERSLAGLSTSLEGASSPSPAAPGRGRPARAVGAARSASDLAPVRADLGAGGSGADLAGSGVRGTWVAVGDLSGMGSGLSGDGAGGGGLGGGGGSGSGRGDGSGGSGVAGGGGGGGTGGGNGGGGAAPGVYRSNASLLAVIQRYAAGIQYCYGKELERRPDLRGKLVVALTVAASGQVIEARVIRNTVGSERLASCALAQIRDWKFPPIPEGVTSFQAPFVFTPPE